MNKNSYICNLIAENPNTWRDICKEKKIKTKSDGCLEIFNYDMLADFSDPIVQEARGIIVNTNTLNVVCWPFRKFGNSHESYADKIDWNSARVQEKIDGSIVKLWYDRVNNNKWVLASNSCIYAKEANLSTNVNITDLFESAENYQILKNRLPELDKDCTYIFELVGPLNQTVIRYDTTKIYHIGTRSNITGEEFVTDIGIEKPKEYPLRSLDECIEAAKHLNTGDYPDNEGFVVVDGNWNRIKVKAPEYLIYHHAIHNGEITKENAFDILTSDDLNLEEFCKTAPDRAIKTIKYYQKELEKHKMNALNTIDYARNMAELNLSRKEIALSLKNNKYSLFAFKAIDCDKTPDEIVRLYGKKLLKLIDDYNPLADIPMDNKLEKITKDFNEFCLNCNMNIDDIAKLVEKDDDEEKNEWLCF